MRPTVYHIVSALIRKDDKILLVREQGPDDPHIFWTLPGGVVEPGELLVEAVVREVREETGLHVTAVGPLVHLVELHNHSKHSYSSRERPQPGGQAITFLFKIDEWQGELRPKDPDNFIQSADFVPLPQAIKNLEQVPLRPMREAIIAYLQGEAGIGELWAYRRGEDGRDQLII